ncbi:dual specificity protein phosphatase 18 [Dermacentor andersoni]|uniref:dual specificity protein phosphatase 18 n=1 Tax=Dermacentor andersoni TaxID=34620 RepID=UPI002154FC58|nr:dual specificity protein phosphatase 18-like [Dermacentor andersoni]XP_050035478.1 dual specificity protein phosphatase 18-like [Dermacentor andersoni]XP_050035479.1 dual specificity protein phosphatase 18-like [Dermacentor andersoni]XP_054927463.1 dual specificity protein phosphatase 18-like [Dermacentor andersoni]XP_054927464.1 dual specificity protein phosphatase 18-like [Dermacentor andersoni]
MAQQAFEPIFDERLPLQTIRHRLSREVSTALLRRMAFNIISQVTDYLYLSGFRAITLSAVRTIGITTIINCSTDLPDMPIGADNIEFLRVRVDDSPYFDMSVYFDPMSEHIHNVHMRGGRVLVHCMAGASRSPTLCLAYLMKYHRMRLRDAFRYLKSRRPVVHPNNGFFRQLIDYEIQLFGNSSVEMVEMPNLGPAYGLIPDIYLEECKGLIWLHSIKGLGQ